MSARFMRLLKAVLPSITMAATAAYIGLALLASAANAQSLPIKIMPLGDSITYDQFIGDTRPFGVRTGYRWPLWEQLVNAGYYIDFVGSRIAGEDVMPAFDPDNEGYPGARDDQIAGIVYNLLVQNPPDVILLHIGTNQLDTSPTDVAHILDEIDRFEADFNQPITVVLARIINRSTYSLTTTQFNNNLATMAQTRIQQGDQIVLVDMENGAGIDYRLQPQGDMRDDLHPTQGGYDKMADKWMEALVQILPLPNGALPPVINTIPAQTAITVGEAFSYNCVANGNPTPIYSLTNAPTGMTIDAASGHLTWTPVQVGVVPVEITVSNGVSPDAVQSFDLNVEDPQPPLVIVSGQTQTGTVAEGKWLYYQIQASAADTKLTVELKNLSSDVDLYVRKGAKPNLSDFDCRPYLGGTSSETCNLTNTGDTTWFIGVYGYTAGSFSIKATLIGTIALISGQSQTGTVALGNWRYYSIQATAENSQLAAELTNLSADVDLYVRKGALPTTSVYDCRPYLGGTSVENCTLSNSTDAIWYIGVQGYQAGAFTIKATLSGAAPNQPPVLEPIGPRTVSEGQQLLISLTATDADGPAPLVLSAAGLPVGAVFSDLGGGSGRFSWTPATGAAAGSPYTVIFKATDNGGSGLSDSESVAITVSPGGGSGPITLVSGESQTGTVAQDEWRYYQIDTTSADNELKLELTNLSNDVDLYVRNGALPTTSDYDCRPYLADTNPETCRMANPGAATWYIGVHGYRAGNYTIKATRTGPIVLTSGVSRQGSVALGAWNYFMIDAGEGVSQIKVVLSNPSADVDLYLRNSAIPTTTLYDCRPYLAGRSTETCTLTNSGATVWYIGVQGYQAGSYTITATLF